MKAFVRVSRHEASAKVQQAAFNAGYTWPGGSTQVRLPSYASECASGLGTDVLAFESKSRVITFGSAASGDKELTTFTEVRDFLGAPKLTVAGYTIVFDNDGSVTVGCKRASWEQIQQIRDRLDGKTPNSVPAVREAFARFDGWGPLAGAVEKMAMNAGFTWQTDDGIQPSLSLVVDSSPLCMTFNHVAVGKISWFYGDLREYSNHLKLRELYSLDAITEFFKDPATIFVAGDATIFDKAGGGVSIGGTSLSRDLLYRIYERAKRAREDAATESHLPLTAEEHKHV